MKHFAQVPHWMTRHRGPYRLLVSRRSKGKLPFRTEWLPGETSSDDVEDEAQALLTDGRDVIETIDVWSTRETQFVHTFRRAEFAKGRVAA